MAEFTISDFRPNSPGIMEVFKSGGMQAALAQEANRMGSQANALGHLHDPNFRPSYRSGSKVLARTAIGYVTTGASGGRPNPAQVDQHYHKTLDSVNH